MGTSYQHVRAGLPGSDEPMSGLGDLALYLGGSENSFTGELLKLIVKAQATPSNMQRLAIAFPIEVQTWQAWMDMHVEGRAPTAAELTAQLMAEGFVVPDAE